MKRFLGQVALIPVRTAMLGQPPSTITVAVADPVGRPFHEALVTLLDAQGGAIAAELTDSSGRATLAPTAGMPASVRVEADGTVIEETVLRDAARRGLTIFVRVPVCASQAFLTPVEIGAGMAGVALAGAGFLWKIEPLQVAGELFLGAAAFTAIFRHSCPGG
jgi:hypothetical protein